MECTVQSLKYIHSTYLFTISIILIPRPHLLCRTQSKISIYLVTGWFRMGIMMVKEIAMLQKIIGFFGFRCRSPIFKGSPPLLREGKCYVSCETVVS